MIPSNHQNHLKNLKQIFGFKEFRSGQLEAIESILNGKDVLAILPTGAGKSLIYQYPAAILKDGITLVISPLISLMKEQVDYLNSISIPAMYCNSSQDELEQKTAISRAVTGKIKLLFISPERAVSSYFLSMVQKMNLQLLAIDEAHCISQWGHDFRPEYKQLISIRKSLPEKMFPILALTATATEKVTGEIVKYLGIKENTFVKKSYKRDNLIFSIESCKDETSKKENLLSILDKLKILKSGGGRGIIYCSTRKKVEDVYKFLRSKKLSVGKYHAGISNVKRVETQNLYSEGKIHLLIATNAFGMGMDKPDVRLVLHYNIPSSLEAYYQEAGRAGRDGVASNCILLYQKKDIAVHRFLLRKSKNIKSNSLLLENMLSYVLSEECRQKYICNYFSEIIEVCEQCDVCSNEDRKKIIEIKLEKKKSDYTISNEEIEVIKNVLIQYPAKFGKNLIIAILKGKNLKQIRKYKLDKSKLYASLKHVPLDILESKIESLLEDNILSISGKKYPKIYLTSNPPQKQPKESFSKSSVADTVEKRIKKDLSNYRNREANKLKWKKFMVFHNSVIYQIANTKPKTKEDLLKIKGLGNSKIEKFGDKILDIVRGNSE